LEDPTKRTLYVGGIHEDLDEKAINNIFIQFGFISSVKLPKDFSKDNKHRGFAFVEFEEADDAAEAFFNMNDSEIMGNQIKVNFAMPDKAKDANKPIWETDEYSKEVLENIKKGKFESEENEKETTQADSKPISVKSDSYQHIYMDIIIDNRKAGKLVFQLNRDVCPKTTENFFKLATDFPKGNYRGSKFHRIIPDFMAQGGDIVKGNGTGSMSIFGDKFTDENFVLKHDARGVLSMANSGPNTNGSQFFILFAPAPHLDSKHVVFGKMISGFEVLDQIEDAGSGNGKPKKVVKIVDCGEFS